MIKEHKNGETSVAARWRDDNLCTLDGEPAKIVGWKNRFATVARLDGKAHFDWAWEKVDLIMSNDRAFKS